MIYNCASFKELSVDERLNEVKRNRLCFNCLRDNHSVEKCMAGGCKRCGKKHNTMLHFDQPRPKVNSDQSSIEKGNVDSDNRDNCSSNQSNQISLSQYVNKNRPQVLLSTALVIIYDKSGKPHVCRALLDSGSQSNLVTKELCEKLQLTKHEANVSITGISLNRSQITESIYATIKSRVNEFKSKLPFLVLDRITERLPTSGVDHQQIALPENVVLASRSWYLLGTFVRGTTSNFQQSADTPKNQTRLDYFRKHSPCRDEECGRRHSSLWTRFEHKT